MAPLTFIRRAQEEAKGHFSRFSGPSINGGRFSMEVHHHSHPFIFVNTGISTQSYISLSIFVYDHTPSVQVCLPLYMAVHALLVVGHASLQNHCRILRVGSNPINILGKYLAFIAIFFPDGRQNINADRCEATFYLDESA